jgi:hypothetical protein
MVLHERTIIIRTLPSRGEIDSIVLRTPPLRVGRMLETVSCGATGDPGVRIIIVWSITIMIRTPSPARERMIQVVSDTPVAQKKHYHPVVLKTAPLCGR